MTGSPKGRRKDYPPANELKKLFDAGHSAAVIAGHFGVTRNSIIGIFNRDREQFPKRAEAKGGRPKTKEKLPTVFDVKKTIESQKAVFLTVAAETAIEKENLDIFAHSTNSDEVTVRELDNGNTVRGKTLMELNDRECKYVVSTQSPTLFCGKPQDKYPYCKVHGVGKRYVNPEQRKM